MLKQGYQSPTYTEDDLAHAKSRNLDSTTRVQKRRKLMIVGSVIAGVVLLALILGLGLGLGLKKDKASPTYPSENYSLVEQYQGTNFFNKFDYWSAADPTEGFVIYQLRANSVYENYTYAGASSAIIKSDTKSSATGINSVRIQSSLNYTQGLFVVDIKHMPVGCGIWPAFWLSDTDNWPDNGEIDILEGVNLNTYNQATLHSSDSCTMKGVKRNETGTSLTNNCHSGTGTANSGCGVNDTTNAALSYGAGFNTNGGGIYAMDWRSNGIRVWFFPRTALPADLQALSDDPTSTAVPTMADWGTATANFPGTNCDIDSHFKNHKIIFDTTFCGTWAGAASTWNASSCYDATTAPTCETYMLTNPSDLANAYWEVKSLNVYQYDSGSNTVVGSEFATTTTSSAVAAATSSRA